MTLNLGSTTEVYRILGKSTNQLDEDDVIARLQEADRKIKARHFSHYMEDQSYVNAYGRSGTVRRTYELYFPVKQGTTTKVYLLGEELQSSEFSVSDNYITIADSVQLSINDQLVFKYTPDFFDDYANYMAAKRIIDTSMVDTNAAVAVAQVRDNVVGTLSEYERMIGRKPFVGRWTDHHEDDTIW
jgi:hypothetical protein